MHGVHACVKGSLLLAIEFFARLVLIDNSNRVGEPNQQAAVKVPV